MRIGLIIYGSLDTLSGGYLYDRKLVDYLRSQGDSVEILSIPWRNYTRHLGDNVNIGILQKLRKLPLDLLLEDELNHPSLFALNRLLKIAVDVPLVAVVHHLRADEEHPLPLQPLYRWVEQCYLRTLDAAVYNSETTRCAVTNLAKQHLPGVVALPAADHLAPPPSAQIYDLIEQRIRTSDSLRLLSVGTVMPRKGLHHLLQALALLPAEHWQLDIVGALDVAPAYVTHLCKLIDQLHMTDRVHLHGRLSDAALVEAYCNSHAFALLSYEGFGIAFLEAMSFGLPVLAANLGAAPELIDHNSNGFLVDPLDSTAVAERIRWLCAPSCLIEMGRAARRRFDRHPTWTESGAHTRNFLRSLLKG
jgi:glycosyltransferase involved in cell wall biosynthesis